MVRWVGTFPTNSQQQISPFLNPNWKCSWTNMNLSLMRLWTIWQHKQITEVEWQIQWTGDLLKSSWKTSTVRKSWRIPSKWPKMAPIGSSMMLFMGQHSITSRISPWMTVLKYLAFIKMPKYLRPSFKQTSSARLSCNCCQEMLEEVVLQPMIWSNKRSGRFYPNSHPPSIRTKSPRSTQWDMKSRWIQSSNNNYSGSINSSKLFQAPSSTSIKPLMDLWWWAKI